jgi:zinc transport system substrate-binding protein
MSTCSKVVGLALTLGFLVSVGVFAGAQTESVDGQDTESKVTVFTSILPQKYFVEKIGGERVQVEVLVSPGKSPATYEPTPQQVTSLSSAKVLFTIGVPFENSFLPTIEDSLPSLEIVDTSAGIKKRALDGNAAIQDPHVWLSPRLVKVQAGNIYSALKELDPAGADEYKKGYDTLVKELDDVDKELTNALAPYAGNKFFVFHPAFGYFGDDYRLTQIAFETGGNEPSPSALEEIIRHAKEESVKIVFVQPEFSQNSAKAIADAIGGAVVNLSPLNPDYSNNLRHIAEEIEKSFR